MADTLPNIPLPRNTWVDLYAASGIAVGTRIKVSSLITDAVIRVHTSSTEPAADAGYTPIKALEFATNNAGESGAWAMCKTKDAIVNVEAMA